MALNDPNQPHGFKRRAEKRAIWFDWLGRWGYSTVQVFQRLMQFKPHFGHTEWMQVLIDDGYLVAQKGVRGDPRIRVYAPTQLAVESGFIEHSSENRPSNLAKIMARPNILHDLAVQHLCASLGRFEPGEPLHVQLAGGDISQQPDAVGHFESDEADIEPIALELELTQKQQGRIYRSFVIYAQVLATTHLIRGVRYYFVSDALRANYQRFFDAEDWPDFAYVPHLRKYVAKTGFKIPKDDPIRERFEFVTVERLWPIR